MARQLRIADCGLRNWGQCKGARTEEPNGAGIRRQGTGVRSQCWGGRASSGKSKVVFRWLLIARYWIARGCVKMAGGRKCQVAMFLPVSCQLVGAGKTPRTEEPKNQTEGSA